jgi:hypothetical protein
MLARWQVSHAVDDGMCDDAPTGVVGGITTMDGTPAKLLPVMPGPWQLAQPPVMPTWFIAEFEKRAPSVTGSFAMLEPLPTWQLSHGAAVGMWLAGGPTMLKLAAGIANEAAAAALWHCAQLFVVLGALAWIAVIVGITA